MGAHDFFARLTTSETYAARKMIQFTPQFNLRLPSTPNPNVPVTFDMIQPLSLTQSTPLLHIIIPSATMTNSHTSTNFSALPCLKWPELKQPSRIMC